MTSLTFDLLPANVIWFSDVEDKGCTPLPPQMALDHHRVNYKDRVRVLCDTDNS